MTTDNLPSESSILLGLDELAELRAARDVAVMDMERQRQLIMAKVQDELNALTGEFQPMFDTVDAKIGELEGMLKRAALLRGESVAGPALQVVYTKPKTTWDSAGLTGYAVAHPEINAFRKTGAEGSASIQARRTK